MRRSSALLLILLAPLAPAAVADPSLDSVVVEARYEPGGRVAVSMVYFLLPAGEREVGFDATQFAGRRVANVRAFLGDREVSFRTEAASPYRVSGHVELPRELGLADRIRIRIDYEVLPEAAPGSGSLVVPLLVVEWPPSETRPETFQATVHLPTGLVVVSAFPTRFERVESIDRTSTESVSRFVLPVVPALLRLELYSGQPPLVTFERGVDLFAIGLLFGAALVGWRFLRESLT